MSGFRDEDDNFDDLLTRSGGLGGGSTLFTTGGSGDGDEEDLNSNPFADLPSTSQMLDHSNSTYLPPAAPSAFYRSPPISPVSASGGHFGGFGSTTVGAGPSSSQQTPSYDINTGHDYTGATPSRSTFTRENAPEPETPSYSRTYDQSQYNDELVRSTTTTIGATALFGDSQDIQYDNLRFTNSAGPQSPFQSSYSPPPQSVMVPVEEQTPFGSPPPLSPVRLPVSVYDVDPTVTSPLSSFASPAMQRPLTRKPDLSSLLGEEKPILPSFKKSNPSASSKRVEGVAGPLGSKIAVLPVSSIGRKTVPGALATLLGLEVEEDDEKEVKPKFEKKGTARKPAVTTAAITPVVPPTTTATKIVEDKKPAQTIEPTVQQIDKVPSNSASPTKDPTEPVAAPVEPEPAPIPPESTESIPPLSPTILETNLPESRPETPQQPLTSTDHDSTTTTPNAQPLKAISRVTSQAASMRSVISNNADHEDEEGRTKYDSIVSPMYTGDVNGSESNANDWPANRSGGGVDNLEERLEALRVETEETRTSEDRNGAPTDTKMQDVDTAMDPAFAQYIFQERPVDSEGEEEEQDRGGASIGHTSGASEEANSVRGTYSKSVVTGDEDVNGSETVSGVELISSPPLPPVPKLSSPTRSNHAGGSLGPSFIITVGDPQKIGNPLNPAAQHTVYTVRTRTTSSAFRKSDFSVLRRFSHFLWLYDALTINNPGVIVPGMPEKSAMGRFGSEFVENRRQGLQAALMKIVAHPMLVGDPDLRLFLESDSFSVDIKQRKLDVPSESKGFLASLGSAISGPSFVEFDDYFDDRRHQLEAFETALRALITSLSNASKVRHSVQDSLAELQTSLAGLASCDLSKSLRGAIDEASRVQQRLFEIGERHLASDEQVGALINVAEMYARLCASARGVFGARIKAFHSWQVAEAGLKKSRSAHEKAKRNGRGMDASLGLAVAEVADAERKALDAKQDFEDVSKLTKAEMARFDKEKIDDFKKAIEAYADGMAERQREVVVVWQEYYEMLQGMVQQQQAGSTGGAAVGEQ
ncbi:BQ5605_C027g10325 [Microbotryum silenes-dioicae]|uniref:BQ5605_C027g10325 protein n=1 Tax=Microbotryum silenes-dioicae TaxID=796604 RepID=A0A2X0MRB9_9BASI|nr:BQ5605_C027g10325 [Microbotryum silenes-dioicae]